MFKRPQSIRQAELIAAQGAESIPALCHVPGLATASAAASVRALALIGGPAAFAALKTWRIDRRARELVRASLSFDADTFGREILAHLPITTLSVAEWAKLRSLDGIRHMRQLTRLGLSRQQHLTDLAPLSTSRA